MALQTSTTNLAFGTWPATTSVVKTVTLSGATGTVSAQVTGSGAAAFSASVTSSSSAAVTFQHATPGSYVATSTLTDSGTGTFVEISLSGTASTNALTFTPSSLSFGDVIVGAPANLSVSVQNPGPLDATLSVPSGPFTLATTTVAAGQTVTVQVVFTPAATGDVSATVTSAWSPPADATGVTLATLGSSLAVSGTGIDISLTTEAPATGQTAARQRMKIDVPNPAAQMTLGARVLDTSTSDPGAIIDGFGLGTPGHGFLNTTGSSSNLWMRAMKSLVLESRDSDGAESGEGIWMVSKGNLAATCGGTASFIGAGGVVIAANKGPAPGADGDPVDASSSLDDPPSTATAEERQGIAGQAAIAFGAIDAIIAFGFGVRGLYNLTKGALEDSKKPFASMAATVGLAGAMGGFAGFSAGVSGLAGKLSGVTIYGEAGVVIGSGGFTGIHSISSLVLSSVFPLMFGVDAEIFAVDALTLTGMRHAVLASHKDVTVQSDGDIKIKANGGGFGPIGTERMGKIDVEAKQSITLLAQRTPLPSASKAKLEPSLMSLESPEIAAKAVMAVSPNTSTSLSLRPVEGSLLAKSTASAYAVRAHAANGINVQKELPAGGRDPAGPDLILHGPKIAMRYGNQGAVAITNAGAVRLLAGGQTHKISMGPATVTIQSGARILLQ